MRKLLNRKYKEDNNSNRYSQALDKGWSFSYQHIVDKDGKIIFK